MLLKLEELDHERRLHYTDIRYVWLNTDDISYVKPIRSPAGHAPGSEVWLRSEGRVFVYISPDELAAAIDPEHACPDPPGACGYYTHYLAYGPADLTHAGFHAACKIFEAHGQSCTVTERTGRVCPTCDAGEKRIRA
jgi:hypothetical protein